MILNRKNLGMFFLFVFFGLFVGSLFWEVIERLIRIWGPNFSLTVAQPLVIDLHVIAVSLRPNIGSLLGMVGGTILFFSA